MSDSSSNATAKRQAAEQAKAEADRLKQVAADAQSKLSQGAVAYFGDRNASDAVKVLTDPDTTLYLSSIQNGAKGDATSLDNMIAALSYIKEANQLRAKEGLAPLKVSDTLMAMSMANVDWSDDNIGHSGQFNVGENMAWGFNDPFDGWYTAEKANYEKDMTDGVLDGKDKDGNAVGGTGHYLNLVNKGYTVTGFAISQNGTLGFGTGTTHGQTFDYAAPDQSGRVMDVDAYLADLTAWRDSLTNADANWQTALSKSKQAAQDASLSLIHI